MWEKQSEIFKRDRIRQSVSMLERQNKTKKRMWERERERDRIR